MGYRAIPGKRPLPAVGRALSRQAARESLCRDHALVMREEAIDVIFIAADARCRQRGGTAQDRRIARGKTQDRACAGRRIAPAIRFGVERVGDRRHTAAVGDDQRRAARQRFVSDQPERLGVAGMDIGIDARHDRRQPRAIVDRAEQADVRALTDPPFQRARLHALPEQDQSDRRAGPGTLDRVDDDGPALFGMMTPDPQQQMRHPRPSPHCASSAARSRSSRRSGRKMPLLNPQRHRRIDAHAARRGAGRSSPGRW